MNGGTGNFLLEKAEAFALRIVRFYQHLSEKGERVMLKQVLRSGTSVGANITEGPAHRRPTSCFAICAGDRFVLRAMDADGDGGLTAAKMVKYTAKG